MKAIVWTKYGSPDGLELKDVEKPVPKDNEVLIKIHATTVIAGDCEMRRLEFQPLLAFGIRMYVGLARPKRITILGQEFSGEVEEVGKDVTLFKAGDQIFAGTGLGMGACAEYICFAEQPKGMDGVIAAKPSNLTFEEAAAVPTGGLEARSFLQRADVKRGERVLINGSGGSIGSIGVQLAKYYGAHVTAVDSTEKLDMLRSIGADQVIDYTQEDIEDSGEKYDVIFDVVGKSSTTRTLRLLNPGGRYVVANPKMSQMIRGDRTILGTDKRIISASASRTTDDLLFLKERIEAGHIKLVIDRRYPLAETAEAHRYVESGKKKGNVVIAVVPPDGS